MTASILDALIDVNISIQGRASEVASFGVLYLPAPGSCSFAGDVARYARASEVATALAATEISATTAAALTALFGLDRAPNQIAVGKIPEGTAQISTISYGEADLTAAAEVYTATIDGVTYTYIAVGAGETTDEVGDEIADLINADTSAIVTAVSSGGGTVTLTGKDGTVPFTTSATGVASTPVVTEATTPATTPSSALDTLLDADDDWYALVPELKSTGFQAAVRAWCESNSRYLWAQTSDARVLDGGDTDAIGFTTTDGDYAYTSVIHHDDDAEACALLAVGRWLSFSPDTFAATPSKMQLAGIARNLDLTTSNAAVLDAINVGYYDRLRGSNCLSQIKTGRGITADARLTIDWLDARIGEALATLFLNASSRGEKISYDDEGFTRAQQVVQGVLDLGVQIGHLRVVLDPITSARISPVATVPRLSAVSDADAAALRIPITFVAHTRKAANGAVINGNITDAVAA